MKPVSGFFQALRKKLPKLPVIVTEFDLKPSPVAIYYLILIPTLFLMVTGYFMVFSAKTIQELSQGGNPYSAHLRTTVIMILGVVAMAITAKIPSSFIRKFSIPIFIAGLALQSLIFPFGVEVAGNLNWVHIPPLPTFQPSEALKLGLTLMLAFSFAAILRNRRDWRAVAFWVLFPLVLAVGLVMAGEDLGTTLVIVSVALGITIVARIPRRYWVVSGLTSLLFIFIAVVQKPSRLTRVLAPFGFGPEKDPTAPDQLDYSLRALGSGGLTGVGAGASKEKWFSLPAAETDFIFSVLGEEFGFLGTFSVLAVFVTLFYGMYRLALLQTDLYKRLVVVGTFTWMATQTLMNFGTVTGYGPIIGVPLPFISHGGSSFIITAICVGVILSIARETAGFKGKTGLGKVFRRRLGSK
ncbi:MAG: putative peptidoglycan glycosyltransferase FtsW [Actinomycetaceae bacterium]|nr:putative peptidoglycan glycosyltransferase FtsW [Actinomycetaceae bacterium]